MREELSHENEIKAIKLLGSDFEKSLVIRKQKNDKTKIQKVIVKANIYEL